MTTDDPGQPHGPWKRRLLVYRAWLSEVLRSRGFLFLFVCIGGDFCRLSFAVPRRGCSSLAAQVEAVLFVTFYADVTEGRYGMLEHFFPDVALPAHCPSRQVDQHLGLVNGFMQQAAQHRESVSAPARLPATQGTMAEAQETFHEPILINAPPVRVGCPYGTYIRAHVKAHVKSQIPPTLPLLAMPALVNPLVKMFALSCPISMIQSHLSLSRTRTLGSGTHSLLGWNPTLRPLEQTWAPDKQARRARLTRKDSLTGTRASRSLARTHREAPITSPDSHAPSSSRPPPASGPLNLLLAQCFVVHESASASTANVPLPSQTRLVLGPGELLHL